jgi:hypothetical protein
MTLEDKQLELLEKNKQKRAKQNGKNASGPRKSKQPTQRSPRSVLPSLRAIIADPEAPYRYKMYIAYLIACYEEMKVLSFQEFYKYKEGEESSVDTFAEKFKIREVYAEALSGTGQREAVSVDG